MKWMMAFREPAYAGSNFMPPQGTDIAVQYDNLYSFLLWSSLIACAILIGGMIFFVLKYRRKTDNDKTPYISHNTFLEFLWSFIPLVIFLACFGWGWVVYHNMRAMPEDALEIHVTGYQWGWDYTYKSGKISGKEFYVPVNTNVKLIMTSKDVLHSFFIPSMRIKQDVIPGTYTALWFNANKTGNYQVFCTEYCGKDHSAMLGTLKVVPLNEYETWLQESDEGVPPVELGEKLFTTRGCVACHSVDGSPRVGPTWKGLFGSSRELADGSSVAADENYLREAILNPNSQIVKGFAAGQMPTFQGSLTETQLMGLIEYIKTLK